MLIQMDSHFGIPMARKSSNKKIMKIQNFVIKTEKYEVMLEKKDLKAK